MYGKGTPNGMEIQADRIAFTEQCAKAIIKRQDLEKAQSNLQEAHASSVQLAKQNPMEVKTASSCSSKDAELGVPESDNGGRDPKSSGGPALTTSSSVPMPAATTSTSTGLSFAARAAAKAASASVQRPQPSITGEKTESKEEARDRMYQEAFERMRKMKEQQLLLRKQQEEQVRQSP